MRHEFAPPHFSWKILTALLLVFGAAGTARPQTYPAGPITLIVASAPGAGVDFFARILGEKLPPRLGQAVIIENRAGASGMIGAALAAKAAPDGHTLFLMANTLIISPYVLPKGASIVNVISEFAPIIMPVHTLMVLAVNWKSGINSVQELIALAKRQPGLPYAGGVSGSPMHVLGEQFKKATNLDLVHIPYKSVAASVTAVIGGQINVAWMPTSGNLQYFKAGMLRALATAAPTRSLSMPDVPTMIELGYKNIQAKAWFGLLAPRATPIPVIARLNKEVNAILALPDVREKIIPAGYEPEGGGSEVLAAQMREDDARYRKLVAEYGIRAN